VPALEQVGGGEDLHLILVDLTGHHRPDAVRAQGVPGLPGLGPFGVKRPAGGLEPTAGELPLR
jgi:hypothetical protein